MPQTGRLYLSVNDDHLPDNTGEFRVVVEVQRSVHVLAGQGIPAEAFGARAAFALSAEALVSSAKGSQMAGVAGPNDDPTFVATRESREARPRMDCPGSSCFSGSIRVVSLRERSWRAPVRRLLGGVQPALSVSCDGQKGRGDRARCPLRRTLQGTYVDTQDFGVLAALAAFILFAPALAQAQDQRFRVSFAPAVATVGGDAELALAGTFGYRFSEHFSFEGDLTWIDAAAGGFRDRNFEFDGITNASDLGDRLRGRAGIFGGGLPGGIRFPNLPGVPIDIGVLGASADGSTMVGTLGIRYELPVQTERFRPYIAGGLGINHTDQELSSTRPRSRRRSTSRPRTPATRSTRVRAPACGWLAGLGGRRRAIPPSFARPRHHAAGWRGELPFLESERRWAPGRTSAHFRRAGSADAPCGLSYTRRSPSNLLS